MNNIQKYTEELSIISKEELLYIFFNLLNTNKISFAELSTIYTQFLQEKDKENRALVCELGFSLVMYKDKVTGGTWKDAEIKANKALIQSRLFKGTKYEEKLKKKLDE